MFMFWILGGIICGWYCVMGILPIWLILVMFNCERKGGLNSLLCVSYEWEFRWGVFCVSPWFYLISSMKWFPCALGFSWIFLWQPFLASRVLIPWTKFSIKFVSEVSCIPWNLQPWDRLLFWGVWMTPLIPFEDIWHIRVLFVGVKDNTERGVNQCCVNFQIFLQTLTFKTQGERYHW